MCVCVCARVCTHARKREGGEESETEEDRGRGSEHERALYTKAFLSNRNDELKAVFRLFPSEKWTATLRW